MKLEDIRNNSTALLIAVAVAMVVACAIGGAWEVYMQQKRLQIMEKAVENGVPVFYNETNVTR